MDQRPKYKTLLSSVAQSRPTLCDSMDCSTPGFPIHHQLPVKNRNIRLDTIKLLEENIGGKFFGINHSSIFLDLSPKEMKTKAKINKWDLIKHKSFCLVNQQFSEWEKLSVNDMTDKGLISKIYKKLTQFNIKKQTTQLKNGRKAQTDFFFKEDRWQMANRYMKRCLTLLIIRKNANPNHNEISSHTCQNGYHQKDHTQTSVVKDVEKKEPSYSLGGNANWCGHCGKQYGSFSRN